MKRLVATFADEAASQSASDALREADVEPEEPAYDNPFFDPTTTMPEERGLRWGAAVGGLVGALLLLGLEANVFWVPRISPIMTAGPYALVFLGLGLGVAVGGFVGGVVGTFREAPSTDDPRVAVTVPDHRVDEITALLRDEGATAVAGTVTHHEHPQRERATGSG
ncbi:hypothetical protein SAMN05216559_1923 [Halomicrobium zhouii]|uniref:Uncharacterized protein n=1 Tax=Halomicrobium zhouii TaxID=767519 RepID=A0A1I6L2Z9_9EURY|nr:hypothetical protein [Halomicrobium zhouii]SFR97834.1 hypothetical protein SAMN05216559_1923 [Halomicrobium zhouii]